MHAAKHIDADDVLEHRRVEGEEIIFGLGLGVPEVEGIVVKYVDPVNTVYVDCNGEDT